VKQDIIIKVIVPKSITIELQCFCDLVGRRRATSFQLFDEYQICLISRRPEQLNLV